MKVIATIAQVSINKANEIPRKNKLPVTVILGDSIVKDEKSWKLSDKKIK